ncbi:MAG: PAS domain S-box protein [Anaerolineaceae bacterium]|nr:PAS domain S-box protein [Anaerolineaceae bacterium]MCB9100808.1 PAS domain S-box protein [Anaerolineales bacterium]
MEDKHKTKEQLIRELNGLRQQVVELKAERQWAEAALQESEERFRGFSEAAFEGIAIHKGGIILDVNQALAWMFGYEPAEMIGQNALKFATPKSGQIILEKIRTGSEEPYEAQGVKKDGTVFWVQLVGKTSHYKGQEVRVSAFRDITEYKRAEQELVKSQRNLQTLFDSLNDYLFVLDMSGRILEVNLITPGRLGYAKEELLGESILMVRPPDQHDEVMASLAALIAGTGDTCHVPLLTKSGAQIPVETKITMGGWENQQAIFGVCRDMTERKRSEEALQQSEERYRGIFDDSVASIYIFDDKKNFMASNQAGLDLLGYSKEELLSMSIPDVDADPVVVLPAHEQLLSGDRLVNYEHRLKRKDGRIISVLNNSRPLTDTQGNVTGMLSTLVDITERKQAEEQLIREKVFTESLINSLPGMFYLIDVNGKFLQWNKNVEEITGYSAEEVAQRHPLEYFEDKEKELVARKIQESFETGRSELEASVIAKNGRKIPFYFTGVRIMIDGQPHLLGIATDISERKQAEAALKRARDELEARVEERTRELRESEALFRGVSEQSPNMIFINSKGRVVYVNEKSEAVTGYRKEEFYAPDFDFRTLLAPDSKEIVLQNHSRHLRGEEIAPFDYGLITKAGKRIDVMIASKLITFRGEQAILGILVDITERKQAELQIKTSLEEKEALLKEIHHRVKNNLQVIASMLNMQTRYTQNEQIIGQLLDSRNRVYSMALVHENLYRSETLARVDIAAYVSDLIGNILQSYRLDARRIELNLEIEQIFLPLDQAVPCGLIINELVTNALKYAFPETMAAQRPHSDEIAIAFYPGEDEMLVLMVADNGVGLPEGLDLNASKTLGLRLVRTLVRQLGATLDVDKFSGTTFKITINKADE